MKIDYKTIPVFLELDKKEVKTKLNKANTEYPSYEQDLYFDGNITVVMELNYNTTKWQFKEWYNKGVKMAQ